MKKFLISTFLLLSAAPLFAATPKFNIVPVEGAITSILLPTNFTETVNYQVTNLTSVTRTLTMMPITGVTQTTSGVGVCPALFTLSTGQSCTLALTITGSQVPVSGIKGGPVICKTKSASDPSPDPSLCSQPATQNILNISVTTAGQHAYIANQIDNTASVCQVNPATGLLTQCAIAATGLSGVEGVGLDPSGNFFYAANPLSSSITVCQVNKTTGALSNCVDAGGSGFNLPDAVAFSPDGTIFYTSNFGGLSSVSACLVNTTTGLLSSCVTNTDPSFSAAGNMALNAAGTLAYVVNRTSSTVSVCNVSGQTVNLCNTFSDSTIDEPEGVTLSASGLYAYIANAGSKNIAVCQIRQDSTGALHDCSITSGQFNGTGNIGFDALSAHAYVPNQLTNDVGLCDVTTSTGLLSNCRSSLGTGFVGPAGVSLR